MCYNLCSCEEQEQSPKETQPRNMKNVSESISRCICTRKRKEHDEEESSDCKHTKSSDNSKIQTSGDTFTKTWTLTYHAREEERLVWNRGEKWNSVQDHEKMFMEEATDKKHQSSKTSKISKKISDLQKQIEELERKLEEKAGHPLSKADKLKDEVLSKLIRKQMKLKKKQKETKDKERKVTPKSMEDLRDKVVANMDKFRKASERPFRLEEMTFKEKEAEKNDLAQQLELVEEELGGLTTKDNRQVLGDLYLRLRQLKRSTRKPSYTGFVLTEIPENESIQVISPPSRRSSVDSIEEEEDEEEEETEGEEEDGDEVEEEWHTMNEVELQTVLKEMRQRKRKLGRLIQEFQQNFMAKTGRKASGEDKEPIKIVYRMYKKTKHRIKLLDALLFKFNVDNFNGY